MKIDIKNSTDKELVNLLRDRKKSRSDAAFTELYNRHESRVFSYCVYMLGDFDAAKDIFQETFVRFYKNIKMDYQNTNVIGYLLKIARNLCYNYKRDKKITIPVEFVELVENEKSGEIEDRELFGLIMDAVDMLDLKQKEAFIMRELDGLTYSQIAEITGISLTGVQSRVTRAKERIVRILEPYVKDLYKLD